MLKICPKGTSGTARQLVPAGKKGSTEQNLAQKGSASKDMVNIGF